MPLKLGLNRPLRMAALGDFHFDPICEADYVARVAEMVARLRPDIIIYTGDFMSECSWRSEELAGILSRATAPLGSYAAIGNHEHIAGVEAVTAALERHDIHVLCNASILLPGEERFFLTGIDSLWGRPDLNILSRSPANSRHILLAHEPDTFLQLDDPRVALQIAGHTHGGQIRLPFYGALHLPIRGKKFDQGLFERDGRYLYVNRGIGTLPPHVRFDCRPEITVFELT